MMGSPQQIPNRAMAAKVASGEAIDLSDCLRLGDWYVIPPQVWVLHAAAPGGKDFCNAVEGRWIWSIARSRKTGVICASHNTELYRDTKEWECIWLR